MVHLVQTVHLSCTDTTPSPNQLKLDSKGPMSLRSFIGCIINDFRHYGTLTANRAPILRQDQHYLQMDRNELPVEPCHLGEPSGVSEMISMVHLAQTVHLSCIQTDWNKIPHDPCHVGVPSGASKMISEHMVRSPHTVHLSCVKVSTISKMDRKELPLESRHLGEPLGASKLIYEPMVHLAQIVHRNELPHDPCHVGVPSGASKMISKPMVRLAQTEHLACIKISTISKRT
jgi:hypothetical protein